MASVVRETPHARWTQAFSSSSRSQLAASDFVTTLPGHKLSGSLFILRVNAAKKIESFSAIPSEQVAE